MLRELPPVVTIDLNESAQCLLEPHVELIPAARRKRFLSDRAEQICQASGACETREQQVFVVRSFERPGVGATEHRSRSLHKIRKPNPRLNARLL